MSMSKKTRDRLAHCLHEYILHGLVPEGIYDELDDYCHEIIRRAHDHVDYRTGTHNGWVDRGERRIRRAEALRKSATLETIAVRVVIEWELEELSDVPTPPKDKVPRPVTVDGGYTFRVSPTGGDEVYV